EFHGARVRHEDAEKSGVEPGGQRGEGPDRQQDGFAAQIVTHLDFLLVLVGGLIHLVIVFRLEEEVTHLARGHRHEPADQGRDRRILEHHRIGRQKAYSAYEVQRLVNAAVMVEAVSVPTLHSQGLEKALHGSSPCCTSMSTLWRFDESRVTDAAMPLDPGLPRLQDERD